MTFLGAYANKPGPAGAAPNRWPPASRIVRNPARPTLVLLAHPHCPCTNATLGELERLLTQARGKADVHVLFVLPDGLDEKWAKGDLWQKASAIPGVSVEIDDAGREARLFRMETSGATLLYGKDGRLLFAGGITLSRGHAGDNAGRTAITAFLNKGSSNEARTPVYGCGLFAEDCRSKEQKCER